MPERTKKDHKHSRQSGRTGSRWHNFHFSGKLISCSVIFGFLLILVGGILLAIGIDRDEERKSDDYDDLQKKPPLVFVGPVVMGIGGFTVVVGIIMCLVETKVFRRRGGDANPLINGEGGDSSRDNEAINSGTDPTTIPSDSKRRKHHNSKKSHRKAGSGKKLHSSLETSPSSSQSSEPISISNKGSKNFLNASDTFLTPPGSFTQDDLQMQNGKRDAVNQTTSSLMKSFNSSGAYSTEFQTPSASFIDTPSFPSTQNSTEVSAPQPFLNIPGNLDVKSLENSRHKFLTPQNSNADILEPAKTPEGVKPKEENSPVVNRHAFLTPKNSADLLEESPPIEETLEHRMGNSSNRPDIFESPKLPTKFTTMSVVADVHQSSMLPTSDVDNDSDKPSASFPIPLEEVEHSDIKVDVLIDAIDEEVKGNVQSGSPNTEEEAGKSSVTENTKSVEETVEATKPYSRSNSVNAHSLELTSGDNLDTDDPISNEDLDSRIDDNVDSLNNDE